MFDVVAIGSANLDLVVGTSRHPAPGETVIGSSYAEFPGGKGLNQAVAASRSGASTCFVGAVGDDEAGARLREVARSSGVDVEAVRTVGGPTGRALITVDDGGENSIVVVPGANAHVTGAIPRCRVLIAQLEIPLDTVNEAFAAARLAGATTVLNPAPATPLPRELLANTTVIIPNEHEARLLGGPDRLAAQGPRTVIVTRGASGVRVMTRDTAISDDQRGAFDVPAFTVSPVDTTGAGDAFCGSFAARISTGASLAEAVRWASAAGALATTRHGAVPAIPDADEINALLAGA